MKWRWRVTDYIGHIITIVDEGLDSRHAITESCRIFWEKKKKKQPYESDNGSLANVANNKAVSQEIVYDICLARREKNNCDTKSQVGRQTTSKGMTGNFQCPNKKYFVF